jgi:hypothetical protein
MRYTILLLFVGSFVYACASHAAELGKRVEGGDLIFRGAGDARTADAAQFKARQAAVKMLAEECGVASRDTKFGQGTLEVQGYAFLATQEAYISFSDCEAAKHDKSLESAELAEAQAIYLSEARPAKKSRHKGKRGPDEAPPPSEERLYKNTMQQWAQHLEDQLAEQAGERELKRSGDIMKAAHAADKVREKNPYVRQSHDWTKCMAEWSDLKDQHPDHRTEAQQEAVDKKYQECEEVQTHLSKGL